MKRFFIWVFLLVIAAIVTFLIVREVNYDKWYNNETTTETIDTLMDDKDSTEVNIDTLNTFNTINTVETNE